MGEYKGKYKQRAGLKRWLLSAALGLVLAGAVLAGLFTLAGGIEAFGSNGAEEKVASTDGDTTGASESPASYHAVVDSVGRKVRIPESPDRIACMDSFSGNVAVLIGAGGQLMGVPGGVRSNELLVAVYPGLAETTQLSGNTVNAETLLAGQVDIALVKRSVYENGDTKGLDRVGIPFVVVDYATVEEQIQAIALVGQVCSGSAEASAEKLIEAYRSTVSMVEEHVASIPEAERVRVYHAINDALLTDGSDSLGADWIARAGCIDVSAGEAGIGGMGDCNATLEQVHVWDPDMLICNVRSTADRIRGDAQWRGIPAVAAGQVYHIPVSASRWGQRGDPETFLAVLWLAKTAYPDLFEDIDMQKTVADYYRSVAGLAVDDALWAAIVSGEGIRSEGGSGGGSGGGS